MSTYLRKLLVPVLCVSLGACSSIGSVNGINVGEGRMGVTENADQPYCNQNAQQATICIVAGILIVGGLVALAVTNGDNNSSGPPSQPPT